MPAPEVAILMGSENDWTVMQPAAQTLTEFGVTYEARVLSAHRTPARTAQYVREADGRGVQVFIVGAGMAAHLAGAVAANTTRPVLGVPLEGGAPGGLDALLSTVQMPRGIPVGTLAIGKTGAANAGLLAAQILALSDTGLARRLFEQREEMARTVEESGDKARRMLDELLGS